MKQRIITAAILVPILLLVVLVAPKIVAAVIFGFMLAIAAYELLYRTGLVRHKRLVIYSCAMAFGLTMWSYFGAEHAYLILLITAFVMVLFAEIMASHVRVHLDTIGMCMIAGFVVPILLSSLIRILVMKIGKYVILIPFVVAFLSDAGAYFTGYFMGKHKLAPVISPNKTIEGVIGGVVSAVVGMLVYALILSLNHFQVNYIFAFLYGLIGSLVGVFGDLCFSAIKRQTGIKDYGNLIPGHGGILDRFDSMMTVAPLMEVLLILAPLAV